MTLLDVILCAASVATVAETAYLIGKGLKARKDKRTPAPITVETPSAIVHHVHQAVVSEAMYPDLSLPITPRVLGNAHNILTVEAQLRSAIAFGSLPPVVDLRTHVMRLLHLELCLTAQPPDQP